jgi:hypothetical protein
MQYSTSCFLTFLSQFEYKRSLDLVSYIINLWLCGHGLQWPGIFYIDASIDKEIVPRDEYFFEGLKI